MSFILSVTIKSIMLGVVVQKVIMLNFLGLYKAVGFVNHTTRSVNYNHSRYAVLKMFYNGSLSYLLCGTRV